MSFIGQNLKDWTRQLDYYINDQRPINIEEMRNLQDILRQTIYSTEQVLQHIDRKSMPTWLIQNMKNAIG